MSFEEKEALKKAEIKKYTKIYDKIPDGKKKLAAELIEKLATVCVDIAECEEHLMNEGNVTSMPQGNYSIERENPYSNVKDKRLKTFLNIIQKLDSLYPDAKTETVSKAGESLAAFIAKGK